MASAPPSPVLRAIDALKHHDRDAAVALLHEELRTGPPSGERWRSVAVLAARIGEVATALEASRRYAATAPVTLERLMFHWSELATHGRTDEAAAAIGALSASMRNHPLVRHFRATIASERGDFAAAEALYAEVVAEQPTMLQSWFALAMIRGHAAGDPQLDALARVHAAYRGPQGEPWARFLYGLAKAYAEAGDRPQSEALYAEGAAIRRAAERFDADRVAAFADRLIRDFTPAAMARLAPSGTAQTRAIFVNGLPRSGTTLVEQLLTAHSAVSDGGEVNLVRAALLPTADYSLAGALAWQDRAGENVWTGAAATYHRLLDERFGTSGRVVDKTLSQSHFMGLLMHMLPDARVLWLRRAPEDAALSCYRTYFTAPIAWSWSMADIGAFFRIEDRLFAHWHALFPDRILPVPYAELVQAPDSWIPRILTHVGLAPEPGVAGFHEQKRSVRTASVQQVRSPIATDRIGTAAGHDALLADFRTAYSG